MTNWIIARSLAILAGVVIVLAACGPAGPAATAPGSTTTALPTPPAFPDGPDGLPSFALPPFTGNAALEALLPDELGGTTVAKLSMSGDDFVRGGGESAADFLAVLSQSGWSPAELSVAFASTSDVILAAYRVNDVDASLFFEAFRSTLEEAGPVSVTDVTFGGKPVKKFVPNDGDTIYLYPSGDVLFSIDATDERGFLTDAQGFLVDDFDELLNEAFSKLP